MPDTAKTAMHHKNAMQAVKETLESLVIAFILAFVFRAFVVETGAGLGATGWAVQRSAHVSFVDLQLRVTGRASVGVTLHTPGSR